MAQTLGNIGSFFSSGAGKGLESLVGLGATGAGLAGNLSADSQRAAAAKQAQANANLSPTQLGNMVTGATQPLNAQLVQAITGNVNANQAEMGLSEAPGLTAQAVSQGLAPYEAANQQTALKLVLSKLGLPAEFARLIPQNSNLSPLIALLMKGGGANPFASATGGAPIPGYPTTGPNIPSTDTSGLGDFGSIFPTEGSAS